jgi:hypothetical protein
MAVEQIRPDRRPEQWCGSRRKILNVSAGTAILSTIPGRAVDSFISMPPYLQNEGMPEDHTTIFRRIQAYAAELEKRIRPHLRMSNGSWRVDETYVKVKGRFVSRTYLRIRCCA